jgi:hypothetical protein
MSGEGMSKISVQCELLYYFTLSLAGSLQDGWRSENVYGRDSSMVQAERVQNESTLAPI